MRAGGGSVSHASSGATRRTLTFAGAGFMSSAGRWAGVTGFAVLVALPGLALTVLGATRESWWGWVLATFGVLWVAWNAFGIHALRSAPAYCAVEGPMSGRQRMACAYPFFQPGPRPGTVRVIDITRVTDHRPFRWRVGHRIVSEKQAHAIMVLR